MLKSYPFSIGSPDAPKDTDKPEELTKKMMLKIIQRYHSDRNGRWGEEWHVLSEEVSCRDHTSPRIPFFQDIDSAPTDHEDAHPDVRAHVPIFFSQPYSPLAFLATSA